MRDQRTLWQIFKKWTPWGSFTEVAGSDCCLKKFALLWMILHSLQNSRHRKLENATVETQEQDLVPSSGSTSSKGEWRVTQKAVSMPTCSWAKSRGCPFVCGCRSVIRDSFFKETWLLFSYIVLSTILLFIRTFVCDEKLMQRSDDSSIYQQSQHEPERVVSLKKLPEWPKGQDHSFNQPDSRLHSVQKIFSV